VDEDDFHEVVAQKQETYYGKLGLESALEIFETLYLHRSTAADVISIH